MIFNFPPTEVKSCAREQGIGVISVVVCTYVGEVGRNRRVCYQLVPKSRLLWVVYRYITTIHSSLTRFNNLPTPL